MIFRGSQASCCVREIVAKGIDLDSPVGQKALKRAKINPRELFPSSDVRPFLYDGHVLQQSVIHQLEQAGIEIILSEAEGRIPVGDNLGDEPKWDFVGHIDGYSNELDAIIEVKAITSKWFAKLAKASDWRSVYGHYQGQAQVYLQFKEVKPPSEDNSVSGNIQIIPKKTIFFFKNRDSSQVMGGLDLPGMEYRKDMVEYPNEEIYNQILDKHKTAYKFLTEGPRIPPKSMCDRVGWCFFCRRKGIGKLPASPQSVIYVPTEFDPEVVGLLTKLHEARSIKKSLNEKAAKYGADVLQTEVGTYVVGEYI